MFELMLPEPAQFYVESKLYANAASLDLPKYPEKTKVTSSSSTGTDLSVKKAEDITEELFNNVLSKSYKLDNLNPPVALIEGIQVVNGKQRGVNFTKTTGYNRFGLKKETYKSCSLNGGIPTGYVFLV